MIAVFYTAGLSALYLVGALAVGTDVDAITGATVSSKSVTAGVNAALAAAGAIG